VTPTAASATATATLPVLPEAAQHPTRDGAAAFLTYFFAVYDYIFDAVDSAPLARISDPTCKYCARAVAAVDEARREGLTYSGGRNSVVVAVAAPGTPSKGILVNALVRQTGGLATGPDGTIKDSFSASPGRGVDAIVRWDGQQWKAAGIVIKKSGQT
jgi:hypothetical protein